MNGMKQASVLVLMSFLLSGCFKLQVEPTTGPIAYLKRTEQAFTVYAIYSDANKCLGETFIRTHVATDLVSSSPNVFAKIPANQLVSIHIEDALDKDSFGISPNFIVSFYPKMNQHYQIHYDYPNKPTVVQLETQQTINIIMRKTYYDGLAGMGGTLRCQPLAADASASALSD